ncbi:MAG: inorganic phosphate transporter [Bacteroidetes bacterium]|nr:inorganic phosphate transporter [Bacteroidota bacterium]
MTTITLLIVIIAVALIFDLINGFHDAANSIATVVSTKVLTPFQAVLWAAVFNVVAFWIFDLNVADTVSKTVIDPGGINLSVVLAGLIAAIVWNLFTWWFGIPSSSSHTLMGGFAGAAVAHAGTFKVLDNEVILKTAGFIVLAPLIGMVISFIISILILNLSRRANPYKADRWFKRLQLVSSAAFSIGHGGADSQKVMGIIAAAMMVFISYQQKHDKDWKPAAWMNVEKKDQGKLKVHSAIVMIEKGEYSAFDSASGKDKKYTLEHVQGNVTNGKMEVKDATGRIIEEKIDVKAGSLSDVEATGHYSHLDHKGKSKHNDSLILHHAYASISRGKLKWKHDAGEILLINKEGKTVPGVDKIDGGSFQLKEAKAVLKPKKKLFIPDWIAFACYAAIGLGTMMGGWKIVKTMGTKITKVTPLEGVAAETAGAVTLYGVSQALGVPVSTTHTITGAIIGVGMTKRLSAVRWGVTVSLLWAWVLTIPVSGLIAGITYWLLKFVIK